MPRKKVAAVRRLQDRGRSVALVGDGVHDAAALVQLPGDRDGCGQHEQAAGGLCAACAQCGVGGEREGEVDLEGQHIGAEPCPRSTGTAGWRPPAVTAPGPRRARLGRRLRRSSGQAGPPRSGSTRSSRTRPGCEGAVEWM
ncbi:hypothetical protein KV557_37290 [Kitasatospora aureofaciens]|nr:hypothetical protein [Kitasatospora aureofaciens]